MLLAPFDDHMAAAHGSHVSVTHRCRHSCKGRGFFAHKSIYWLDIEILIVFALSNLTIAVKFLTERKRR